MVCARNDCGRLDTRDAILLEDVDTMLELTGARIPVPLAAVYGELGFAGSDS